MLMPFKAIIVLLAVIVAGCAQVPPAPNYGFVSTQDNHLSYDYKLHQLEDKERFLWPIAVFPEYGLNRIEDMTTRHYFQAINLSYGLKALPKEDHSFILPLLNRGMLNFTIGDHYHAFRYWMGAKQVMESLKQEGGIIGTEQAKIFKGEVYEQSLAAFYLGLLFYQKQDFQNARAMFAQAIELDRESIPDDPEEAERFGILGNDLRLAYYMLARTYAKLGDISNAHVSLRNSNNWQAVPEDMRNEVISEGRFLPYSKGMVVQPTEFEYSDYSPNLAEQQRNNPFTDYASLENDNLVLLIGLGNAPRKVLGGLNFAQDYIAPAPYLERSAKVYVDGKLLGESFPMYNMLHQAAGTHRSAKDTMQTGKALIKGFLTLTTSLVSSSLSKAIDNNWNVAADGRYWGTAPNEIHLVSGRVEPGLHSIKVEFYDSEGNLLSHYQQLMNYVPVKDNEETLLYVRAIRDHYNTLPVMNASELQSLNVESKRISLNVEGFETLSVGEVLDIIELHFEDEQEAEQFRRIQELPEYEKLLEFQSQFGVSAKYLVSNVPNDYDDRFSHLTFSKVATLTIDELNSSSAEGTYTGTLEPNKFYLAVRNR